MKLNQLIWFLSLSTAGLRYKMRLLRIYDTHLDEILNRPLNSLAIFEREDLILLATSILLHQKFCVKL